MNDNLRHGLSALPTPRNDFEIVIPENMETDMAEQREDTQYIEDQADVDNRMAEEIARKSKYRQYRKYAA